MLSLSSGLDIYFLFARRFWPMFLKAHLTIPYASLSRLYQASCKLRLCSAPFCFSFFTMCSCMFTWVVSVLFVKLQVCDLKHSRAAELLSLSHRARVRELALSCKCVPWLPGIPGDCYPGMETNQRTRRRPFYLNSKEAACYKWATDTNKLNNLPKFLLRRFS